MQLRIHSSLATILPSDWNALITDNNPFLRYEYLYALETCGCIGAHYGWLPKHITLYDNDRLIAALPLYEKHNNYGEFVFDQAWSQAWQQVGLAYYPKLVSTIPYAPVSGKRLMAHPSLSAEQIEQVHQQLLAVLLQFTAENYSGCHILFAQREQQSWLQHQANWLTRNDCQFHWFNQGYQTFDDFLSTLKAKKRKNIRQERASIEKQGIQLVCHNGHTASKADWKIFNRFYQKTFIEKWGTPTLNEAFFCTLGEQLPDQILLVLAYNQQNQCIAGALLLHSDTHLYGRHWGAVESVKHLHFEACFYQGIEFAIQKGLKVFEPGAGGEHKIARGFIPVLTQSTHWLGHNPFPTGIDRFIAEEQQIIQQHMQSTLLQSPYTSHDTFYQHPERFIPY